MLKTTAARTMAAIAAITVVLALGTPKAFAQGDWFINQNEVFDTPNPKAKEEPRPYGHINDPQAELLVYNQLKALLVNVKFPNKDSVDRLAARHQDFLKLFRDDRSDRYFKTHGILVADGTPELKADPLELTWLGVDRPAGEGGFQPHYGPQQNDPRRNGLFMLGALAHMGHFALINSNNPDMRAMAKNVAHELAAITPLTGIAELPDTFRTVENNADAEKGGYSALTVKFDGAVMRLDAYVVRNFDGAGLWYYSLGADTVGLVWLYLGQDEFNIPTYWTLLDSLARHQPWIEPKHAVGTEMQFLVNYPENRSSTKTVPDRAANIVKDYFPR